MIQTIFKLGVVTVSECSCRKATRRTIFVSSMILLSSVSTATSSSEPDTGADLGCDREGMPREEALRIVLQVARVLAVAHASGETSRGKTVTECHRPLSESARDE